MVTEIELALSGPLEEEVEEVDSLRSWMLYDSRWDAQQSLYVEFDDQEHFSE